MPYSFMSLKPLPHFLILFFVAVAIIFGLSSLTHGPKPRPANIDASQFSAGRAFVHLEDLLGRNIPHPTGSAENLKIRQHLERKFKTLGYEPQIQAALGCTPKFPGCSQVENIIVHVPGTGGSGDAIMLSTHYDSVPASVAAADDGAGTVALLEIARILKSEGPLKNDVIFLITDGEEGGLRGAQAFADQHPLMETVKLVINLEARGASGPSTMFETSDGNLGLIRTYTKTAQKPVANSLSYEIYKRLPNDTDYSVYKRLGVAGLNFAFTGDVSRYHSALDDLQHLSKASLQHHGDNALAALTAFGNEDLSGLIGTADATYFDVFGRFIIKWPSAYNLPLALLCLLVTLLIIAIRLKNIRGQLSALALSLGVVIGVPLMGWLLSFPLGHWPQLFYLDHPTPWPGRIALMGGALLVTYGAALMGRRWLKHANYNALICSAGVIFALGAIALAVLLPGGSYLVLVPALAIILGVAIDVWRKHQHFIIAAHLGFIAAAYMALYHFLALEVIANYGASYIRILPMILLCLILLPLFKGHRTANAKRVNTRILGGVLIGLTAISTGISATSPGFDSTHPRGQNLVYIQDSTAQTAQWISVGIGGQDENFLTQAGFNPDDKVRVPFGLTFGGAVSKPAPYRDKPGILHTIISNQISGGVRSVEMDIRSSHQGYVMLMAFDQGGAPDKILINGQETADFTQSRYRRPVAIRGPKADVFRISLSGPADTFIAINLVDTYSLKADELEGMAALRPENSAPIHAGDRAHIMTKVSFK